MKDLTIMDEETGVTLTYKWRDSYGWCVSFCDKAYTDENIDLFRVVMKNSRKHWPEVPEHLQEEIDRNNQEMVDVCRSMTIEQKALIDKACSRKNLGREEQRRLGLELKDALVLNKYQAKMIKEMRDEIIKLKIQRSTNEIQS